MKTPRYWPCIFLGLLLLGITILITLPLKHAPLLLLKWLYGMVNYRGPAAYVNLWIGFSVGCAAIHAFRRHDFRRQLAIALLGASLLPLPIGALSTYSGLLQIRAYYASATAQAKDKSELARLEQWRTLSIGVAWDSTVLAFLVFLPNVAIASVLLQTTRTVVGVAVVARVPSQEVAKSK